MDDYTITMSSVDASTLRVFEMNFYVAFQVMCTRRRVMAVWLSTSLILAAISCHFFATVTYQYQSIEPYYLSSATNTTVEPDVIPICFVLPAYDWFFVNVWYWIDFTLLAFVPFVVILTGNCVMVTCVVRAAHFRYRHHSHPVGSAGLRSGGGATAGDKGKAVTSSTVMLMTLSIVFLLTTSPNVIYFLKIEEWVAESSDAQSEARLHLGFTITNLLYYTNNASNFFLYCLAGSRFRRAMCQVTSRVAKILRNPTGTGTPLGWRKYGKTHARSCSRGWRKFGEYT